MDNLISLFWVCWTWKFFPRYYWLGCLVTDRFGIRTSLTPILVKCKRFTGLFRLCMAYRSCKFYLRQKLHRSKVNYFSSCSQLDFDCVWNRKDVSNRLVTSCIGSNFYRDHRIGCVHGVHVGEIWHNLCNKGKSLYRVSLLRYGLREHTLYLCQSELVLLYFNYLLFFFFNQGLDLRIEHFHCFSDHGEGGHYHYDVTPDHVHYTGFFSLAEKLYRIDRPLATHHVGRDWRIALLLSYIQSSFFSFSSGKMFRLRVSGPLKDTPSL